MKSRSIVFAGLFSLATAAAAAPHGIEPADINRNGNACTDFFDYANGAWRKENAIPDYMDRWSRRWQSGEINKEHVRDILDEVSARRDWPAGSAEQLSGDFYGACMDESRDQRNWNRAGASAAGRGRARSRPAPMCNAPSAGCMRSVSTSALASMPTRTCTTRRR